MQNILISDKITRLLISSELARNPLPLCNEGPETKGGGIVMNNYEVMYIIKAMEEEATEAVISKFEALVANNGGTVEKTDRWGRKRLAYEIKDTMEAYYVLMHFDAPSAAVAELDRVMKITDEILRHMIIKKGE